MKAMETGYVLIVGEHGDTSDVGDVLANVTDVARCPGSSHVYCPAVHGEPCALRAEARAAVVHLAGAHEFFTQGQWECVTAGKAPTVVVLDGDLRAPRAENGFAVVGSARGPEGVLTALAELVD